MTPEEVIELLKGMQNKKVDYAELVCAPAFASRYKYVYPEPEDYAIEEAIKALKEVQQYREIGTVEECREAREKQNSKNSKITHKSGAIYCNCPSCGLNLMKIENNIQFGHIPMYCEYCGQAIKWDTENLEGMEDE